MNSRHSAVIARIDLSAIKHNCAVIQGILSPGCGLGAVVKCNAYGHGVEVVLPALVSAGIQMLCVATINEAEQLRQLGWKERVLLLMPELGVYVGEQKKDIARWLIENEIGVTCVSKDDVHVLQSAAEALNKRAAIHLMLDSGMSRMGVYEDDLISVIDEARQLKGITIEGLYTHFADSGAEDGKFAGIQLARFNAFVGRLKGAGINIPVIHAANSGAVLRLPQSHFNMVRAGLALYGYYPDAGMENMPALKPSMEVVSFLTLVKKISAGSYVGYGCTYKAERDMCIGLVPVGYGDGYDRRLSNAGRMMIGGHVVPVIGRVSMDQTIIDLGPAISAGVEVRQGTEVVVISKDCNAVNSVESIAAQLGTIPYEIVTGLGDRILRQNRVSRLVMECGPMP